MKIAPSILSANFAELGNEIKKVEKVTDILHYDVMDGNFVPNISFGPKILGDVRKVTKMFLDVHLMILNPHKYISEFVKGGADMITFHLEAYDKEEDVISCLKEIKKHNIKCGLSIKPATPVSALDKYLEICDHILVMSVEPGFGGQKFMPASIDKVNELSKVKEKHNLMISIDGGINASTWDQVKDTCLDFAVAGSYVFGAADPAQAILSLTK